ncbi:MAG: hypothetical protein IKN46_01650 [Acholeplasmatales bacterium]|nr:hypothetical protein [Acholeplasmatales bacterium]
MPTGYYKFVSVHSGRVAVYEKIVEIPHEEGYAYNYGDLSIVHYRLRAGFNDTAKTITLSNDTQTVHRDYITMLTTDQTNSSKTVRGMVHIGTGLKLTKTNAGGILSATGSESAV